MSSRRGACQAPRQSSVLTLRGVFLPLATPFDAAGGIYWPKLKYNLGRWNQTGLAGYVVCGPVGEVAALTEDEILRLWEQVAELASPDKVLIAFVTAGSVRQAVELANRAASLGYRAAMAQYLGSDDRRAVGTEVQTLYYQAIADQARIPVIVSSSAQLAAGDMTAESLAVLLNHPNIVGIEDSSGDLEELVKTTAAIRPAFQVLAGAARTPYAALRAGAAGAVVPLANAVPLATLAVWEAARAGDHEAARDWHDRIADAARLVTTEYGIPGLKYAMDLEGYYGGRPRLPLIPPRPEARRRIKQAFQSLKG
ncbi:MAG: dihydrodipicolinate synthase family protein [Bryobacteraceae bacterium]